MVELVEITKDYGDETSLRALDRVNLCVDSGESLVIVGPSGSGKSTLLNIIGSLDRPTSGRVVIGGREITELNENELADLRRHTIGFVFQLFHLVPTLTAIENVMMPLLPYRHELGFNLYERAKQLLEDLKLLHRTNHLPGQLSGGEQQRVAIARALVNNPKLVLADEPTGNLDSDSGQATLSILNALNQEHGITVIMATHDLNLATQSNRMVTLLDGHIVAA